MTVTVRVLLPDGSFPGTEVEAPDKLSAAFVGLDELRRLGIEVDSATAVDVVLEDGSAFTDRLPALALFDLVTAG